MKMTLGLLIGPKDGPQDAPRWLLAALQQLEVTQGDGGQNDDFQQGFKMTLRAERTPAAGSEYGLFKTRLLDPGNRVVASVTLNARPRVLFDGIIAYRQLSPTTSGGPPSLTVMGKDISILMDLDEKDVDHTGLGDKEIATTILGNYTGYGIRAKVADPPTTWTPAETERSPRQVATDRQYLQTLAARHSFIFRIKPGPSPKQSTGYWGPLEYDLAPQKALTVNMGSRTNVETLAFADDALAPAQMVGAVDDQNAAEATPIDVQKGSESTALAKTSRLASADFVRTLRLVYSTASAVEAKARAQGMADRSAAGALKATGTLDTFRYGELLQAPGTVGVRGAGTNYDGDYYVRSVTHVISRTAYTQRFTLTREGPGTTVDKVKP